MKTPPGLYPSPNSSAPTGFTLLAGSSDQFITMGSSMVPIAGYQFSLNVPSSAGAKIRRDTERHRMTVPAADDTASAGAVAWAQIYPVTAFENWKAIALAGAIGRQHALRESKSNRPFGRRYAAAINDWLESNGFHKIESAGPSRLTNDLMVRVRMALI